MGQKQSTADKGPKMSVSVDGIIIDSMGLTTDGSTTGDEGSSFASTLATTDGEYESTTRSCHSSDTSYGLSSLVKMDLENAEIATEFVKLRPEDEVYLKAAREFISNQPTFKRKALDFRVVRRLQIGQGKRRGYTALVREVIRRKAPEIKVEPSVSATLADLTLEAETKKTDDGANVK